MAQVGTLDAALEYAAAGFKVFPIWAPRVDGSCQCPDAAACGSPGKHPHGRLVPRGLHDASDDEETIRAWWRQYPAANVGLVTGGPFFVLDIDDAAGAAVADELVPNPGAVAITGSGNEHWFFAKDPEIHVRNQQGILWNGERRAGLDVRGDGGYVVAPPSVHASGGVYTWMSGRGFDEIAAAIPALLEIVAGGLEPASIPRSADPMPDPAVSMTKPPPAPVPELAAEKVTEVRAALACIPPNEDRTSWVERVSMPLHDLFHGSDQGYQVWAEWCRRGQGLLTPNGNPAYRGDAELQKVWRSFSGKHRNPKGEATFWQHAGTHGYGNGAAAPGLLDPLPPSDGIAPWREPESLDRLGVEYVQLDVERAFPPALDWLRSFVSEVARLQQVPVEFPALLALGAAAGACGNVYQIRFTGTGWTEQAAIWALCAFETGGGKSPVYRTIAAPFHEYDAAARVDDAKAWREWQTEIAVARAAHERAKRRSSSSFKKADDSPIKRDELDRAVADSQRSLLELEEAEPPQSGILGSDFTTEALVEFLERHHGRGLILDPEGSVFGYALDAANPAALDPWVKSFTGEAIQQDRVSRGRRGRYVKRPCLSMALCTQISELSMFSAERAKDKGFAWRFLPAVFRRELPAEAVIFGTVPADLTGRWAAAVQGLLEIPVPETPHVVELGAVGAQRLTQWLQEWLERAKADPHADSERVGAWDGPSAPKIRSYALRLTLLLHVLSMPDPIDRPPSPEVLDAVLSGWVPYLVRSVETTMALAQDDQDLKVGRRVLDWVERRGAPQSFSRSEVFRNLRSSGSGVANVGKVNDLNAALAILTDTGWIQPIDKVRSRGQGVAPTASRFAVHPQFREYYR